MARTNGTKDNDIQASSAVRQGREEAHQIKRRQVQMVSRKVRRFIIAVEVMALGAALFVGAGLAGGSIASAAEQVSEQPAGSVLMAPPDCITIIGCTNPPVFEPTPTPTCATRFCSVVDLDDVPVFEVQPADPTPTPCPNPTSIRCTDIVGPTDGGVLDPGDNNAPTSTPEPTEEPEVATPEATPAPTEEPAPTQPPAPTTTTGQGNNGGGNGNGGNGGGGSQGNVPAAPQGGQQTSGNVPVDGDEDDATAETKDESDASESEANESVQVVDEDGGGMGLLGVILVAVGVAVPASAGAFLLARRQKASL